MQLTELLQEKRDAILKAWLDYVLADFHKDATRFFKSKNDQFANPLGFNTKQSLEELFRLLAGDAPASDAQPILEDYIKMRAVQGLTPSAAVAFIFELKNIIRHHCLGKELSEVDREVAALERRIDQVALMVFDIYIQSRELLYQVRINEIKRGTHIITDGAVCPSALMRKNMEQL